MSELSLRLEVGDAVRLGPGKMRLLELIAEHGSISAAGRAMGMSYRHAWLLVDSLNAAFREPVVLTRAGGKADKRAEVTQFGHGVIARFRAMQDTARAALADDLRILESQLRPDAASRHMRDPEHQA